MTIRSTTIDTTYDDLDRLTSEVTPEGSVAYTYDGAGRRATATVAGQPSVTYDYDDADRLTGVTQASAAVTIAYDDANRRTSLTFPNGIVTEYGYDDANQLISLVYRLGQTVVGDITYQYDGAGQRVQMSGSFARTALPQTTNSAMYDDANQLVQWQGQLLSYDPNGSLTSDGLTSHTWNARNQLIGLSGRSTASFRYDALGRRRGKTVEGLTTNFHYDGFNLIQEQTVIGTPTANLLTGLSIDETLLRTDGTGTSALLTDILGSTVGLSSMLGAVQTQYTIEPFGATTVSGTTSTNLMQFTGRENDGTGLYAYRARYYSPTHQRFISEDPIGVKGGPNLYAYAVNNPLSFTDPLGLDIAFCYRQMRGVPKKVLEVPHPVVYSTKTGKGHGFGQRTARCLSLVYQSLERYTRSSPTIRAASRNRTIPARLDPQTIAWRTAITRSYHIVVLGRLITAWRRGGSAVISAMTGLKT